MKPTAPRRSSSSRSRARAGKCLVCDRSGVHEPNAFAYLNGGALKKIGKDIATISPDLWGFLSVGVHEAPVGARRKVSASVDIAERAPLGQFEFYFCGTRCLRRFLNSCVDTLERKLAKHAN